MSMLIWLDDDGKEIKRERKGRGRPPRGTERREDGNFYVRATDVDRTVYYMIPGPDGTFQKVPKGRGRPKPGFVKGPDGHWYQTAPAKAK